jgi:hypothetical protein
MSDPLELGRYTLFAELASGGMATVYLGRLNGEVGFGRTVAVKRLHPHLSREPEFAVMFLDEARMAARVQHPNVVGTLDVVATGVELFLVMEYVHGESLGAQDEPTGIAVFGGNVYWTNDDEPGSLMVASATGGGTVSTRVLDELRGRDGDEAHAEVNVSVTIARSCPRSSTKTPGPSCRSTPPAGSFATRERRSPTGASWRWRARSTACAASGRESPRA